MSLPDSRETDGVILLVEGNPIDEGLMIRALRRGGVVNPIAVARDGTVAAERGAVARRFLPGNSAESSSCSR